MNKDTVKIILILIFLTGACLLMMNQFAVVRDNSPVVYPLSMGYQNDEKVQLKTGIIFGEHQNGLGFLDGKEILVFYTLSVDVCPSCINEIDEYIALASEFFVRENINFEQLLVFDGASQQITENKLGKYIKITGLLINGIVVNDKSAYSLINLSGLKNSFIPQINFYDLNSEIVFYRNEISLASLTSKEFKSEILTSAYQSYISIKK